MEAFDVSKKKPPGRDGLKTHRLEQQLGTKGKLAEPGMPLFLQTLRRGDSSESQLALAISQPDDAAEQEANRMSEGLRISSKGAPRPDVGSRNPVSFLDDHIGVNPIDSRTRSVMESHFGEDFGEVTIHTGPEADRSARSIDALAYTTGADVVFRSGQYPQFG